jgi:hypothetical protein
VFFFVDHQRRIEIMTVFLPLCKSFEEKNHNNAKQSSGGSRRGGRRQDDTGTPGRAEGQKSDWE